MRVSSKGSQAEPILLSVHEAAEWLSVPKKVVRKLVDQGVLLAVKKEGNRLLFDPKEVAKVAHTIERDFDLPTTTSYALQALALARRAEESVREILYLSEARYQLVGTEPEEIEALYRHLQSLTMTSTTHMPTVEIRKWARVFARVNVAYLMLVRWVMGTKEPWKLFLDVAGKIASEASVGSFVHDPDRAIAYKLIETARTGLRQESYFYCRELYGPKAANSVFPEVSSKKTNEAILALL